MLFICRTFLSNNILTDDFQLLWLTLVWLLAFQVHGQLDDDFHVMSSYNLFTAELLVYNVVRKSVGCKLTEDADVINSHSQCKYIRLYKVLTVSKAAVLARPFLSICPFVTFRYCFHPNEDMILWFTASGKIIFLVSEEVKFIWIFAGDHPQTYTYIS